MEFKVVVSDPESGNSYQREVKDEKARRFKGLELGEEVDGSMLGLEGYKIEVTGGSDKSGFPMKKGVHGATRPKSLMTDGLGYNPEKKGMRRRKRIRGEKIDDDIAQINVKITKKGRKSIEELFGLKGETSEEADAETGSLESVETKEEIKETEKPVKEEEPKPEEASETGEKDEDKAEEKPKEKTGEDGEDKKE